MKRPASKPALKLATQRDPLTPAIPTVDEIAAVQAVFRGDPSKEQCRVFTELLLIKICGCTARTFSPVSAGIGAFAEGQRDVGLQINGLRSIDLRAVQQKMEGNSDG